MRPSRLKIKYSWPFDAAITVALLALVVSSVQLLVTAPLLTGLFLGPKLVISGRGSLPDAEVLSGVYTLENKGNAPATKIEVGFAMQQDMRVTIMPQFNSNVVMSEPGNIIRNARIEIERLNPGETILIVLSPGPNLEMLQPELVREFKKLPRGKFLLEMPQFSFLRSAEGGGTYIHTGEKH